MSTPKKKPMPAVQRIKEEEVPEDISAWIENEIKVWTGFDIAKSAARDAAIAMYHKKQEDLGAKEIQIAGLLASNKDWGDKYLTMEKVMLEYRKELIDVKEYLVKENYTQYPGWIQQLLDKYPLSVRSTCER